MTILFCNQLTGQRVAETHLFHTISYHLQSIALIINIATYGGTSFFHRKLSA